jgi:hypothetical protein
MSNLEKLDLMGVASLAAVTAALLVGWIATTSNLAPVQHSLSAGEKAITLTREGSMKLTVTASRESAVAATTRPARVASSASSTGTVLHVALPLAFRP